MGCEDGQILVADSLPVKMPPEVVDFRRNVCRECEHATKDPTRVHLPTKGLNCESVCKVVAARHPQRANIKDGTERADVECPLGRWGKFLTAHESPPTPHP